MGFFAVSGRDLPGSLDIAACHICFWVLPKPWYKLFGYTFCFDIGLRLKSSKPLRRIRIALPLDGVGSQISDLSGIVLDHDFSPLIFGKPVVVDGNFIKYDGPLDGSDPISDRVISVSSENSTAEHASRSDLGFSIWNIELQEAIIPDEWTYVRFRVSVERPWRIWSMKGWGYAKRGAIVDLRICEIRESLLLGHGEADSAYLVPIKSAFVFLVVPSHFVPNHFSPSLHYSRLLEPRVWEKYLTGIGSHTDGAKFSIHQWRYTNKQEISVENPFRAYMDLSREFGKEIFFYYAVAIVSLPIISHIFEWAAKKLWVTIF